MQDFLPGYSSNDHFNQFDQEVNDQYFNTNTNNQEMLNHESQTTDSPDTNHTRNMDTLSNYSGDSTNESSKNSDQAFSDKNTRIPPIIRKGIHKYYEPIVDGSNVYRYEENPSEYKKARKRIQNRESACRVRSRKKNYVEEIEVEMDQLRSDNNELRVKNASLEAENKVLKQRLSMFEKMVKTEENDSSQCLKNPPQQQAYDDFDNYASPHSINNNDHGGLNQNYDDFFLPLEKDLQDEGTLFEEQSSNAGGLFRYVPQSTFKKHVSFLGVLTMLVCCFGLMSDIGVSNKTILIGIEPYASNTNVTNKLSGIESTKYYGSNNDSTTTGFSDFLKYGFGFGYSVYILYVLLVANWNYIFKKVKNN